MSLSVAAAPVRFAEGVLHVIVTCTKRKTQPVDPGLRIANLPSAALVDRVDAWTSALENASGPAETVDSLYAGDHWQVARSIAAHSGGSVGVNVWVVSAGYGLVQMHTPLHPYAATFARRHADSVVPRHAKFSAADWWRKIACWRPAGFVGPRTLEELSAILAADDASFLLISLSESYAAALSEDIRAAAARLADRVGVVSIGSNSESRSAGVATLDAQTIPGDARMKAVVGGAMQSLNVRITRRIVEEAPRWFPSRSRLANLTAGWLEAAPPAVMYDRVKLSDEAVRQFIVDALQIDSAAKHTALLRRLRDGGQACEQARFRALFQEVKGAVVTGGRGVGALGRPVPALPVPSP